MNIRLEVQPAGKATACTFLTQEHVDEIRGKSGRGHLNIVVGYGGETFRTCVSLYRGRWMFVINKAMRAAGLLPGDTYAVEIERDDEPKIAKPATDMLDALKRNPEVWEAWNATAMSRRRAHVDLVEQAKKADTRQRRIDKVVATLARGERL